MPTQTTTRVEDMTNDELDSTLLRLYTMHRDATTGRRAVIHTCIEAVIGEQARRLDEWLATHKETPCTRS